MNKKTTKMELFMIMVVILLKAGSNLQSNIGMINSNNYISDKISEAQHEILVQFMTGKISLNDYNTKYILFSGFQSRLDTAKDFMLACVASIIAQLTIMIDLIFRPM